MKTYQSGRQEDAHEYLRFLLDEMQSAQLYEHKHLRLDAASKETNAVSRIFGGYWMNSGERIFEKF